MNQDKYLIPLALVIAGILVGGAIFFKSGSSALNQPTTPENIEIPEVTADDHMLGNPNADIVIVEYSDIDCPFCADFHDTMNLIIDEYGRDGRVAWVYRNFPLDQLHPEAREKAESAECVASIAGNDVYWQYLDALFARDEKLADLPAIAASLGVDEAALKTCVDEDRFADRVQAQYSDALAAGGGGTPHSLVVTADGGIIPIEGAQEYKVVKQVIETILASEPIPAE